MVKTCRISCAFNTDPFSAISDTSSLPASALSSRALQIHLIC